MAATGGRLRKGRLKCAAGPRPAQAFRPRRGEPPLRRIADSRKAVARSSAHRDDASPCHCPSHIPVSHSHQSSRPSSPGRDHGTATSNMKTSLHLRERRIHLQIADGPKKTTFRPGSRNPFPSNHRHENPASRHGSMMIFFWTAGHRKLD